MSAPRWKPPNTELQIGGGGTSPYLKFQQIMPQQTAAAIQNSPQHRFMFNALPEFKGPHLHKLSHNDLNSIYLKAGLIEQSITTDGGDPNPWNKALWGNENQYGRRDEIIAGLGGEEVEFLSTQSNAWEPTATTPSAPNNLADELTIA